MWGSTLKPSPLPAQLHFLQRCIASKLFLVFSPTAVPLEPGEVSVANFKTGPGTKPTLRSPWEPSCHCPLYEKEPLWSKAGDQDSRHSLIPERSGSSPGETARVESLLGLFFR